MARPSVARALRQTPTPFEIRFWRLIHPLRQTGWHFRKQAPIGRYVVDFVCHRARLVVEIDGLSHFTAAGAVHDAARTVFLEAEGYRVLRFANQDLIGQPEGVYLAVVTALRASGATPSRPPP